jgi:nanoRNase/pAp phosphatase (c-di-AMP/oligoRNAs hydrolase)
MKQVSDSEKILLVTPDKLTMDAISSTLVLAEALRSNGKTIEILTHQKNYEENFSEDFPQGNLSLKRKITSNKFSFKFEKGKDIDHVNINETSDGYNLEIQTRSGTLTNSNVNLTRDAEKYDLIVLVGCSSFDSSREFASAFGSLIAKSTTLLIGYTKFDIKTDDSYIRKAGSISEVTYSLLKDLNINPTQSQASKLLAGIISNTNNLKINTSKETLETVQKLVHTFNGDFNWANKVTNKSMTEDQFEWQKEVFANTKRNGNFAYSIIENQNIHSSNLGQLNNEDKVPIHKLAGIDVALTLTKLSKTVHGFLYINSNKYSGLSLTNDYPRVGDNRFVYFWTKENPQRIIRDFQNKIGITSPKEQIQEKATIRNEIKAILDKPVEEIKVAEVTEVAQITEIDDTAEITPEIEIKKETDILPRINLEKLDQIEIVGEDSKTDEKILEISTEREPTNQHQIKTNPPKEEKQNYDPLPPAF